MKTLTFVLSLLFLVSCGKDNTSGGSAQNKSFPDPIRTDAEIHTVTATMNGLMIQGTMGNYAIPLPAGQYEYHYEKQLVVVEYRDRGPRMKVYNALGRQIYNGGAVMMNKILKLDDTAFTVEYIDQQQQRPRVLAMNSEGRILVNHLVADRIRAEAAYGVVAVSYKIGAVERVMVMRANGQVLIPDTAQFISPRLEIAPYVITLRHSRGVEQIRY